MRPYEQKKSLDNQIFQRCVQTVQQRDVHFKTEKMTFENSLEFPLSLPQYLKNVRAIRRQKEQGCNDLASMIFQVKKQVRT